MRPQATTILLVLVDCSSILLSHASQAWVDPGAFWSPSSPSIPRRRRQSGPQQQPLHASSATAPPQQTVPLPGPPAEWTDGLPPAKHALFLQDFWQKKPLLIRQAFDPAQAVVGPSELLALACDDLVTSRLIEHAGDEDEWTVRPGPFDEEDFETPPRPGTETRKWTVLVQEVDRHVPEVADLLQAFPFVPNWRVDDMYVRFCHGLGGC